MGITVDGPITISGPITIIPAPIQNPFESFLPLNFATTRSQSGTIGYGQFFMYMYRPDNPLGSISIPSSLELNEVQDTYLNRYTSGWFAPSGTNVGFYMLGEVSTFGGRTHLVLEGLIGESHQGGSMHYIQNTKLRASRIAADPNLAFENPGAYQPTADTNSADAALIVGSNQNQRYMNFSHYGTSTNTRLNWKRHIRFMDHDGYDPGTKVLMLPGKMGSVVAWRDYDTSKGAYLLRITAFDPFNNMRWSHTLERTIGPAPSFAPAAARSDLDWARPGNNIGLSYDEQGDIYLTTNWFSDDSSGYELFLYKIGIVGGGLIWKKGYTLSTKETWSTGGGIMNIVGNSSVPYVAGPGYDHVFTIAIRPIRNKPYSTLVLIRSNQSDGEMTGAFEIGIGGGFGYLGTGTSFSVYDRFYPISPEITSVDAAVNIALTGIELAQSGSHNYDNLNTWSSSQTNSGKVNKFKTMYLRIIPSGEAAAVQQCYTFRTIFNATSSINSQDFDTICTDAFGVSSNQYGNNGEQRNVMLRMCVRDGSQTFPLIAGIPLVSLDSSFVARNSSIQIADDVRRYISYFQNEDFGMVVEDPGERSGYDTGVTKRPFTERNNDTGWLVQKSYPDAGYVNQVLAPKPNWEQIDNSEHEFGSPGRFITSGSSQGSLSSIQNWLRPNWGYFASGWTTSGTTAKTRVEKPYDSDWRP